MPPLTVGEQELAETLLQQWQQIKPVLQEIISEDIKGFNDLLREKGVQYIAPKKDKKQSAGLKTS